MTRFMAAAAALVLLVSGAHAQQFTVENKVTDLEKRVETLEKQVKASGAAAAKRACDCGPTCECTPLGSCDSRSCPANADRRDDPYGFSDYAKFRKAIASGRHGELYVGIPDASVGTYTPHCRVPSGFGGLDDGKYDCFFQDGDARLTPVALRATGVQPLPAGASCAGGACAAPAATQPFFGAPVSGGFFGGGCAGGACAPRGIFRR